MRVNVAVKADPVMTHEGGRAAQITDIQALRRAVLSHFLWENEFYEDGQEIGQRIADLSQKVSADVLAELAMEARHNMHLRHVPLYLTALLAIRPDTKGTSLVSETIQSVCERADEMGEFLAIYQRTAKLPTLKRYSHQVRKGLARAFHNFNGYDLSKYNRDASVKLRDVLFLSHAKPTSEHEVQVWQALVDGTLASADTWEVALSGGADKRETFERLIREGKLGYLALLRNLRNMEQSGVEFGLVRDAILARKGARRVLPFRYVAAARAAPVFEPALDQALVATIAEMPSLTGRTVVMVDVSGSMDERLSAKSDISRKDAAATLASMINAEQLRVFSFADRVMEIPPRRGMAGVDAICQSQSGGTRLFDAVAWINANVPHDRLIVITDEQAFPGSGARFGYWIQGTADRMPEPICERAYVINVASAKNGVGYGKYVHLDGFSEQVLRWIVEYEASF